MAAWLEEESVHRIDLVAIPAGNSGQLPGMLETPPFRTATREPATRNEVNINTKMIIISIKMHNSFISMSSCKGRVLY